MADNTVASIPSPEKRGEIETVFTLPADAELDLHTVRDAQLGVARLASGEEPEREQLAAISHVFADALSRVLDRAKEETRSV